MSINQINEMYSYLSQTDEIPADRIKDIVTQVYPDSKPHPFLQNISKRQFDKAFQETIASPTIENQLLYLFYSLDREKKGYLIPEDIATLFGLMGLSIRLQEIENSFKYAKVYKNKMSYEDFKEYFYNF